MAAASVASVADVADVADVAGVTGVAASSCSVPKASLFSRILIELLFGRDV